MPIILQVVLIALIGYLWGSIPAGYWMGKLLRGKDFDIRDYGSHKIGATNVLRTLGKGPAAIVFVFDLTKGMLPTLFALLVSTFYIGGWGPAIAGLCALLGHCFPVLIGFKGGRGVMTGAGVIILLSPLTFVIAAITAISTIAISRYVSLGSVLSALAAMICGLVFFFVGLANPHFFAGVNLPTMLYLVIGPGLVILFHHDNIGRLLSGTERKIGQKVKIEESSTPGTLKA
ncbi:MAG TPA: glycerol-3-phosphate 1-O-acyltransferase PlsY [Ktedonobacteraceae bacterium]|nr:glycerol-3-phosphate 1-O-acyltransferase PlsY [Ktedonobacteraceae bacterium]